MQAALTADVQLRRMKVQLYGTRDLRVITLVAGLPPAVHFGLVYIDTILASKAFLGAAYFGVPKLPAPYDTFEWAVVSSFSWFTRSARAQAMFRHGLGKNDASSRGDRQMTRKPLTQGDEDGLLRPLRNHQSSDPALPGQNE